MSSRHGYPGVSTSPHHDRRCYIYKDDTYSLSIVVAIYYSPNAAHHIHLLPLHLLRLRPRFSIVRAATLVLATRSNSSAATPALFLCRLSSSSEPDAPATHAGRHAPPQTTRPRTRTVTERPEQCEGRSIRFFALLCISASRQLARPPASSRILHLARACGRAEFGASRRRAGPFLCVSATSMLLFSLRPLLYGGWHDGWAGSVRDVGLQ